MLGRHTVTITMCIAPFGRSRLPVSQDNDGSHSALSFLAQPPQPHETITGATAHSLLIASAASQDQQSGDARQPFLEQGRLFTTRHVPGGGHLAHERRRARGGHPRILSSEQQPTAELTSPLHVSDICRKPRSPTARVQLYFSVLPRSRRWFQRRLRRMTVRPTWKPYTRASRRLVLAPSGLRWS